MRVSLRIPNTSSQARLGPSTEGTNQGRRTAGPQALARTITCAERWGYRQSGTGTLMKPLAAMSTASAVKTPSLRWPSDAGRPRKSSMARRRGRGAVCGSPALRVVGLRPRLRADQDPRVSNLTPVGPGPAGVIFDTRGTRIHGGQIIINYQLIPLN